MKAPLVAGVAALVLILPTASQAAAPAPLAAPEHYTALTASVLSQPHPVPGADGRKHLAYELMMLNWTRFPATV